MESMHSRKDAKNTSGELNVIFRTFKKNTIRLGRSRQRGDKTLTPSTHRALRSPRHYIFQAHPLHAAYFEALHRVQDSRVEHRRDHFSEVRLSEMTGSLPEIPVFEFLKTT